MSEQTPNLSLPFIMPSQAQKHVTHNEAIELLDMIVQLTLESVDETTPPGLPEEGQAWAIGDGATAGWAGQDGMIATWRGGGWLFVAPRNGWQAWVSDAEAPYIFVDDAWTRQPDLNNLPGVGVNATADTTNRLSVASAATLLNHEGNGHQVKINKAAPPDTGSLLYQTDFSGRAEMGLSGSDDFSIKVSADGSSWTTPITVAAASGKVRIGDILQLTPGEAPAMAVIGDIYFDSTSAKLRCYDGTAWQDLF
ncbi:DUF2793 domain-containing protein [Yoonia sp. 2307UL14-13]|uniref:DUF2793 domain-containing protein n=1 Tax=Yoonia sp. 2307UL14-13 TaxID=3126506 RepID=UPI003099255A